MEGPGQNAFGRPAWDVGCPLDPLPGSARPESSRKFLDHLLVEPERGDLRPPSVVGDEMRGIIEMDNVPFLLGHDEMPSLRQITSIPTNWELSRDGEDSAVANWLSAGVQSKRMHTRAQTDSAAQQFNGCDRFQAASLETSSDKLVYGWDLSAPPSLETASDALRFWRKLLPILGSIVQNLPRWLINECQQNDAKELTYGILIFAIDSVFGRLVRDLLSQSCVSNIVASIFANLPEYKWVPVMQFRQLSELFRRFNSGRRTSVHRRPPPPPPDPESPSAASTPSSGKRKRSKIVEQSTCVKCGGNVFDEHKPRMSKKKFDACGKCNTIYVMHQHCYEECLECPEMRGITHLQNRCIRCDKLVFCKKKSKKKGGNEMVAATTTEP